jgi:hypothetical protein
MAHFNKRHYEAIARTMQNLHPGSNTEAIDYDARLEMWRDTLSALQDLFIRDNALFMPTRFGNACIPGANVRARKVA